MLAKHSLWTTTSIPLGPPGVLEEGDLVAVLLVLPSWTMVHSTLARAETPSVRMVFWWL